MNLALRRCVINSTDASVRVVLEYVSGALLEDVSEVCEGGSSRKGFGGIVND